MAHCDFADIVLESGGYLAEFSSAMGAACYRLLHGESGREILRTPADKTALSGNAFVYGNPILFPPNRIRGGSFRFCGREYRFPVNEPDTGSHLHGALYKTAFEVAEKTERQATFVFRAEAGEYLGFPHAFCVTRAYRLDEDGLTEEVTVQNRSREDMPLMLAFHTTFCTQNGMLRQAVGREQMRDALFLPTGRFSENERGKLLGEGRYPVGKEHFSALYEAAGDTAYIREDGVCIGYRASRDYRYRMLYAPAGSGFLCIEPQTCAIDCFHLPCPPERCGLRILLSGGKRTLRTRIWLETDARMRGGS